MVPININNFGINTVTYKSFARSKRIQILSFGALSVICTALIATFVFSMQTFLMNYYQTQAFEQGEDQSWRYFETRYNEASELLNSLKSKFKDGTPVKMDSATRKLEELDSVVIKALDADRTRNTAETFNVKSKARYDKAHSHGKSAYFWIHSQETQSYPFQCLCKADELQQFIDGTLNSDSQGFSKVHCRTPESGEASSSAYCDAYGKSVR